MRIRQVRPDFWTDELMATVPDATRLFYIGLWCVADDAGWFRADVSRIGALLYPYRGKASRERLVRESLEKLQELGRVVVQVCGCGRIPTLTKHQVVGGKKSEAELRRHLSEHVVREGTESPGLPFSNGSSNGTVGNGTERNGIQRATRENEERGDGSFKARVGWEASRPN